MTVCASGARHANDYGDDLRLEKIVPIEQLGKTCSATVIRQFCDPLNSQIDIGRLQYDDRWPLPVFL